MPIVATAAWSIPKKVVDQFAQEGSGLTRYASIFDGVEINSTFYRRHKESTFARWAESVPDSFRFAIKVPKEITHIRAMKDIAEPFETFRKDIAPLGGKRGPLLCQLPPSLAFDADVLRTALMTMRDVPITGRSSSRFATRAGCRPRHCICLRPTRSTEFLPIRRQYGQRKILNGLQNTCACTASQRSTTQATPMRRSGRSQNCWRPTAGASSTILPRARRSKTR